MESCKPWLYIVWYAILFVNVLMIGEVNSMCEEVSM
jgi:hypothetical protein